MDTHPDPGPVIHDPRRYGPGDPPKPMPTPWPPGGGFPHN